MKIFIGVLIVVLTIGSEILRIRARRKRVQAMNEHNWASHDQRHSGHS